MKYKNISLIYLSIALIYLTIFIFDYLNLELFLIDFN